MIPCEQLTISLCFYMSEIEGGKSAAHKLVPRMKFLTTEEDRRMDDTQKRTIERDKKIEVIFWRVVNDGRKVQEVYWCRS